MKKIIICLVMLLFLSGCKVKYNVEIVDNVVHESFDISLNNLKEKDSLKYFEENDFYVSFNPDMVKYDKQINKENENTNYVYSHTYDLKDYKDSMALSSCFKAHSIIDEDGAYLISTSDGIKCMTSEDSIMIDKLDVIISSNYKLIDTNADEIKDYTYIWHFDKNNYQEKNIMLKLNKKKKIINYKGRFMKNVFLFGIPSLLILIVILFTIIKTKKSNKI